MSALSECGLYGLWYGLCAVCCVLCAVCALYVCALYLCVLVYVLILVCAFVLYVSPRSLSVYVHWH